MLGAPPAGESRVDLVLAMLRARQIWGGAVALPGLREALGLAEDAVARRRPTRSRRRPRALVAGMEAAGWTVRRRARGGRRGARRGPAAVAAVLRFAVDEVVPRLERTTDELD